MPAKDKLWIFIMAGQSNMAGRAFVEPNDTIYNKRILTINEYGEWIYAKEPLHFNKKKVKGLDCGMSFGNNLLDSIPKDISIAIIPCAVGGTIIEQWLSNEKCNNVKLLSNFESKVAECSKFGTIKAILWHQGESNAKEKYIPTYSQNLKELLSVFRQKIYNDNLPILIGQLGSFAETPNRRKRWSTINSIIYDISLLDQHTYLIDTQNLKHKGDFLHFDSESQRKMGENFAETYLKIISSKIKNPYYATIR